MNGLKLDNIDTATGTVMREVLRTGKFFLYLEINFPNE